MSHKYQQTMHQMESCYSTNVHPQTGEGTGEEAMSFTWEELADNQLCPLSTGLLSLAVLKWTLFSISWTSRKNFILAPGQISDSALASEQAPGYSKSRVKLFTYGTMWGNEEGSIYQNGACHASQKLSSLPNIASS